jgi:hypothetical protein
VEGPSGEAEQRGNHHELELAVRRRSFITPRNFTLGHKLLGLRVVQTARVSAPFTQVGHSSAHVVVQVVDNDVVLVIEEILARSLRVAATEQILLFLSALLLLFFRVDAVSSALLPKHSHVV